MTAKKHQRHVQCAAFDYLSIDGAVGAYIVGELPKL
jgi:hypothetical protein